MLRIRYNKGPEVALDQRPKDDLGRISAIQYLIKNLVYQKKYTGRVFSTKGITNRSCSFTIRQPQFFTRLRIQLALFHLENEGRILASILEMEDDEQFLSRLLFV